MFKIITTKNMSNLISILFNNDTYCIKKNMFSNICILEYSDNVFQVNSVPINTYFFKIIHNFPTFIFCKAQFLNCQPQPLPNFSRPRHFLWQETLPVICFHGFGANASSYEESSLMLEIQQGIGRTG